jgi:hypothetical protein
MRISTRLALIVMAVVVFTGSIMTTSVTAGDIWVRGHVRSNGSYVTPHYRSRPDGIFSNNYSTYPNINPYTGKTGTRRSPSYSSYPRYRTRTYSAPSYSAPSYRTKSYSVPSYSVPSYRTKSYSFSSPSLGSFGLGSSFGRSRIGGR